MAVPSVSAMHEQVHEETGERQQVERRSQYVRAVLREQEHACHGEESKQHQTGRRSQEMSARLWMIRMMID